MELSFVTPLLAAPQTRVSFHTPVGISRQSAASTALVRPVRAPRDAKPARFFVCAEDSNAGEADQPAPAPPLPQPPRVSQQQPARPPSMASRLEQEVKTPFRTFRMFFYGVCGGSGAIGAFFFLAKLAATLGGVRGSLPLSEVLPNLGIQIAVIAVCSWLYLTEKRNEERAIQRRMERRQKRKAQKDAQQ
eukprot:tig00020912_g15789.t1